MCVKVILIVRLKSKYILKTVIIVNYIETHAHTRLQYIRLQRTSTHTSMYYMRVL